jgi:hypothetical protein
MQDAEFFAALREHYDYDPLRAMWRAKSCVDHESGEPVWIPVPPFGITDLQIANLLPWKGSDQ